MKRFLACVCLCVCLLFISGCDTVNNLIDSVFGGDSETGFEVIFFDMDNEISDDGTSFTHLYANDYDEPYSSVKPADCYLIKAGDTEILVDAGMELQTPVTNAYNQGVAKIYQQKIIPQIKEYCTDGVLEYLIVTHGDYDHIIGLAQDDGVLDFFLEDSGYSIGTIIDFDSDLVVYLGAENSITNNNTFFDSDTVINSYREKRDELVENGTVHTAAASFFKDADTFKDSTLTNAMPDKYRDNYCTLNADGSYSISSSYLTNFYYFSDNVIYHSEYSSQTKQDEETNLSFTSTYDAAPDIGTLGCENGSYYYSIELDNDTELRILYNWSYDHVYKHSFDSQNRNNISVCFEVVSGGQKFVSFGDLGFGETGMINYYGETSLLKGVTCFKASHHGSTTNGENSAELFQLMTPEIVVVTGVAQINRDILVSGTMTSDSIYSGLSGTAVMKAELFTNITSGNQSAKIYCTQTTAFVDGKTKFSVIGAPLYGDIYISCYNGKVSESCSYTGEVDAYVSSYSDNAKHFKFYAVKDGSMLSYTETDHYNAIYTKGGKV